MIMNEKLAPQLNQILLKSEFVNTKKMLGNIQQSNILSTFIMTMATGQVPFQCNFYLLSLIGSVLTWLERVLLQL